MVCPLTRLTHKMLLKIRKSFEKKMIIKVMNLYHLIYLSILTWSLVASCNALKNLVTVPCARTCILNAGSVHLVASVMADKHRVPIGLLSCNASRI